MFKIINRLPQRRILNGLSFDISFKLKLRTFLSQAYYCEEVWEHRLNSPILQKVNLEELYYDLEQRFQKTRQMSAVDVDIFVNAVTDNSYSGELLDVVHKLRLTMDTCNTLNSTSHAVVRALMKDNNEEDLLTALDDRLNYGIFLDYYTANLLLDIYWKNKKFTSGARVASQLMLQEEFDHPISQTLSLLHCYNYLLKPEGWPQQSQPEEPEEEVKIRVKYLRNPYDDNHFDLRDPNKIVGKTLSMFTKGKRDPLNLSLNVLGLAHYDEPNRVKEAVNRFISENIVVYKEILDLVPDNESKKETARLKSESADVQKLLEAKVEKAVQETSEKDISEQCKLFLKWEAERSAALEEQQQRLLKAKRLSDIEDIKKAIKDKETKLWFFENEEKIELGIEAIKLHYPKRYFGKKKKPRKIDEGYVPPEVHTKQTNPS